MELLKTLALDAGLVAGVSVSLLITLATWQAIARVLRHWDTSKPLPPMTEIGTSGLKFADSVNATLDAVGKLENEVRALSAGQLIALDRISTLEKAGKPLRSEGGELPSKRMAVKRKAAKREAVKRKKVK